jgi:hypothetical protein
VTPLGVAATNHRGYRMLRAVLRIDSAVAQYWQAFRQNLAKTPTQLMRKPSRRPFVAPRTTISEDGRETLAMLRGCAQTVNLVLVALTDGVELEVWADGSLRRRSRFLRDTEARKYSERLTRRLTGRGYQIAGAR